MAKALAIVFALSTAFSTYLFGYAQGHEYGREQALQEVDRTGRQVKRLMLIDRGNEPHGKSLICDSQEPLTVECKDANGLVVYKYVEFEVVR